MRFTASARVIGLTWCFALVACEGTPSAGLVAAAGTDADGGVPCVRPEIGCECDPGTEAEVCYPEPSTNESGEPVCLGDGLRYCRDGRWGACEVVPHSSGAAGVASAALISGPTPCNPCDPRCFGSVDQPTSASDITTMNSSGVILRPGGVGVQLPVMVGPSTLTDRDADGVPDVYDSFPDDASRDGFTELGGIYHLLPEGTSAGPDPLSISTTISAADIYILMDATASMSGEIANLRSSLLTGNYLAVSSYPPVALTANESRTTAHDFGSPPLAGIHTVTGNTATMANDHTGAGCSNGGTSRDAVFRFTLTSTQTVNINTTGSAYDTAISIRNAAFGEIACNDDAGGTLQSALSQSLGAGTYYILLEGWNGASGAYRMTVQFSGDNTCAGVLGAINCIIPNVNFGVGYFREYPVSPHGVTTNPVYRHVLDLTNNFSAIQTAINGLNTQGNADWPESLTQGLFSAITGNGLGADYPARSGNASFGACPAGGWGYGCFRSGAIPIVIAFTDAPTHEGPDRQFDYVFDERWPTVANTTVININELALTALNMGDLTTFFNFNTRRIYAGSTNSMLDDYNTTTLGCNASSRDAVFSFTLTARRRVQLTTYTSSSSYDTVLSLFRTSITAANRLACNDDIYFSGTQSAINTVLDPGTYYVVVDGNAARGNYYLSVNGRVQTTGTPPYPSAQAPAYWEYTANALSARSVKFIGIRSCDDTIAGDEGDFCPDTYEDLRDIALSTGSVDDAGDPFVYTISREGTGLSDVVVAAVERLANYSRMDVSARATDNAATAFDERNFVQSLTITNCSSARCSGPRTGAMCGQCLPGTSVGFNAVFFNSGAAPSGVARTAVAQIFDFTIELVGNGTYVLQSVPVRIVVPPLAPMYPPSGSYWRDYDSRLRCASNERPDWGTLDWTATVPAGTTIEFQLQAADGMAGLASAPIARILIPPATPTRDITTTLRAAGYPDGLSQLRVTAVLSSGVGGAATPNLTRMAVTYTCIPAE